MWNSWQGRNHFGPFGEWGDPKNTHTTGTPRNHPMSPELGAAIQAEDPSLLGALEGQSVAASRASIPPVGTRCGRIRRLPLVRAELQHQRKLEELDETLGRFKFHGQHGQNDPYKHWRRNIRGRGHGWNPFDTEHSSADLVFDYYTMTGSFWAMDEMRMLGEWIRGTMRVDHISPATSSRLAPKVGARSHSCSVTSHSTTIAT